MVKPHQILPAEPLFSCPSRCSTWFHSLLKLPLSLNDYKHLQVAINFRLCHQIMLVAHRPP